MKSAMRLGISVVLGTAAFFATVLGIEFLSWWWTAPADPLADPAANAMRFVAAAAVGMGGGAAIYRSARNPRVRAR